MEISQLMGRECNSLASVEISPLDVPIFLECEMQKRRYYILLGVDRLSANCDR